MMAPLVTERLVLRAWRQEDNQRFAAMNSDPTVMRFYPGVLSRAESDALAERLQAELTILGLGFLAVEEQASGVFIGFIGLRPVRETLPIAPAVEIGWRLATKMWGRGLATEGARAVLQAAFEDVGLEKVVSYAVPSNVASRRVMEKIGMARDVARDFDHPDLEVAHPYRRQVVYTAERQAWFGQRSTNPANGSIRSG